MSERVCLISYHEIGLKGRNRSTFERRLRDNLDAALVALPAGRVERVSSRLVVPVEDGARAIEIAGRIALIPGVHAVFSGVRVRADVDAVKSAALEMLHEAAPKATFAVEGRRSNTDFPWGSIEIGREVGAFLQQQTGLGVDLTNPDATVSVIVSQNDAYIASKRLDGPGGLPVGTAGRVVSLLSSGIDSPVSTWRIAHRGATVVGVHFSGRPQVSSASERVVERIGRQLELSGGLGRIYVVPFGDIQREVSLASPPDLRVILYRRLMIRIAERIAAVERARALVTGESLGQVASQTLENIAAVDEAARLPVLRPLIGTDKLEIMAEARRLGTYDISIEEAPDCCTLFMPRSPETHAKLPIVLEAWEALDHERMVAEAIEALEWIDFDCPAYRPPRKWPTPTGATGWNAREAAESAAEAKRGDASE